MNKRLSEKEIDALVIAQADDDDAWEKPIFVNRKKMFSIVPPIKIDKDILSGTPVLKERAFRLRLCSIIWKSAFRLTNF